MNRALLVIDVQNEYFDGRLRITYPDPVTSLAAIGLAMDAAHAAGVPIVVVQVVSAATAPIFAEGSHGAALHPSVDWRPRDLLVTKRMPSCLAQTGLDQWLLDRGIDTLTLVGYMTHNCVDATARHASHLGLYVEVLSDATGSLPYINHVGSVTAEELHRSFLVAMQARFASVLTTEAWCGLLPSTPSPGPTGIWQSSGGA